MSHNKQDMRNLHKCNTLFDTSISPIGQDGDMLYKVPVNGYAYGSNSSTILANGLISATRCNPQTSCWIDVRTSYLSETVTNAIEQCAGCDLRLVITHYEKCSHGPTQRFPLEFMKSLGTASSLKNVWHPVLEQMVPSMRNWVLQVADLPEDHPVFTDSRAVAGYYHAVAQVITVQGLGRTVDSLMVHMGGADVARIAADHDDLVVLTRNGMF